MTDQGPTTRNLRLTPAPAARPEAEDQLSTELDAIITIGRALSHIPDTGTRARVMRWAIERFGIDVTPAPEPEGDLELPANIMPAPAPDEAPAGSLNVDGLSELFPPVDDNAFAAERDFTPASSRDRKRSRSSGDRLRDALHWMGL